ncbi:hypothetical protein Bca101_100336 [Brassica carinata]
MGNYQCIYAKTCQQLGYDEDQNRESTSSEESTSRESKESTLFGYCAEGGQRLLVYEYMPFGSVEDHIRAVTCLMSLLESWEVTDIACRSCRFVQRAVLVDCSGDDNAEKTPETAFQNKKAALLQIIEENLVAKTIIFCNKIETCRKVENIFKRLDGNERQLHVLPFHAAFAQGTRLTNMEEFTSSHPEDHSLFLVCTDRASRGIDSSGVDHVVLFDFPRDPSEYVRRFSQNPFVFFMV